MSEERATQEQVKIPTEIPVLPLRDMVLYPFIIAPLSVAREISIQAVDRALSESRMILLAAQKDKGEEEPQEEDLFQVGTVAVIMRMLKLSDERIRVLVQGVCRARVTKFLAMRPYFQARIEDLPATGYGLRAHPLRPGQPRQPADHGGDGRCAGWQHGLCRIWLAA